MLTLRSLKVGQNLWLNQSLPTKHYLCITGLDKNKQAMKVNEFAFTLTNHPGLDYCSRHCLYVLSRQDGSKYVLCEGKNKTVNDSELSHLPLNEKNSGTTCCLTAALGHQAINSQRQPRARPRVGNAAQRREHSLLLRGLWN